MSKQCISRSTRARITPVNQANFLPCVTAEIIWNFAWHFTFSLLRILEFTFCPIRLHILGARRLTASAGKGDLGLQCQFRHFWPKYLPIVKHLLFTRVQWQTWIF